MGLQDELARWGEYHVTLSLQLLVYVRPKLRACRNERQQVGSSCRAVCAPCIQSRAMVTTAIATTTAAAIAAGFVAASRGAHGPRWKRIIVRPLRDAVTLWR